MPIVDAFGAHVVARLYDFFAAATPWYRRLWSPSVLLALEEVLEASHAMRAGILSQESFGAAVQSATLLIALDPGVGSKEAKRAVQQGLTKSFVPDSVDYSTVKLAVQDLKENYLKNWADALDKGEQPGAERTARAMASHLLDLGFSPSHLHRWLTFQVNNAGGANSLAELVRIANTMVGQPDKEFSVLVTFQGVPSSKSGLPPNWVSAKDVVEWLSSRGLSASGVKQNGALLFRLAAKDKWAAVQSAVDTVDQLSSRVALGTDSRLRPIATAWVEDKDGTPRQMPFRRDPRNIEIHALHREDKLYVLEKASIVDAAFQLIGSLDAAPASTALAAGWAAIEALLSGTGDADVLAGHRLGTLVACSFARAELTDLSYKIEASGHAIAPQLSHAATNQARARVVADAIGAGTDLELGEASDAAAVQRMSKLLKAPHDNVREIQSYATAAFVRMYKNRNLVLHWGKTDAVGLQSNLRTAAPLVGAGMDRIAHGWFVEKLSPMELAARARYSVETVGSLRGPHIVDLLS